MGEELTTTLNSGGGATLVIALVCGLLALLVVMGLVFARMYRRSTKELSFVRTGWGGQKVIMNGGALVFPVLHDIIPVNMNTLRLEVRRADQQELITRDRMRVDVAAEFYVRVQPTAALGGGGNGDVRAARAAGVFCAKGAEGGDRGPFQERTRVGVGVVDGLGSNSARVSKPSECIRR